MPDIFRLVVAGDFRNAVGAAGMAERALNFVDLRGGSL